MKGRPSTKKGIKISDSQKQKISKAWVVTTPTGDEINIINLNEYCENVGIIAGNMRKVADGKRNSCSGYKCKRV
jgi:co-chaperonin GroES (HSP10)